MNVRSVTILVCTYNRAALLRETLAAFSAQHRPRTAAVEIVVVDNNSTDATAAVVKAAASQSPFAVKYIGEASQGKSFALNRGLLTAEGQVIALTDDDVVPPPDWVTRIIDDFEREPATFVFGKVLPRWGAPPPAYLTTARARAIWGPLALLDYGDEPIRYVADRFDQGPPIGANLAFLSSAVRQIGGWRTDLGKVNNTLICGEDHEIFSRLRRSGLYRGYYDPQLVVRHHVPPSRLTPRYFRKWFLWHGRTLALMLDDVYPQVDLSAMPHIMGVPRFLYREALEQAGRWLRAAATDDMLSRHIEGLRLVRFAGLFGERWRRRGQRRAASRLPARGDVRPVPMSGVRPS
jgi:glycosyltransferase involved in cell wall biosynthesis